MSTSAPKLERTKTPGVYRRGGRYVVTFTDPAGRRKKRFARTYKEAVRVKSELRTDVGRGDYREQQRVAFSDYAAEWIDTYTGRTASGIRPQTREDYAGLLGFDRDPETGERRIAIPSRGAVGFFGRRRLSEIEPRDVKAYTASLARGGLQPSSVRKVLAPVRALLATAVEDGLLRSNPAAGVRVSQPAREGDAETLKVKALTEAQVQALLDATPDEWRLFFRFLAETGLRIGEAIALDWHHIDLGRHRVLIRRRFYRGSYGPPKSRYGRRDVPVSPQLAQALWELRKQTAASDDDLVFQTATGRMVDPSNLMSRVLKPAAREAGIGSWPGFHTLRHSCATALFRRGLNAKQAQVWLGHHSPSFTLDVYVHLLPDDLPESPFGEPSVMRPSEEVAEASLVAVAGGIAPG